MFYDGYSLYLLTGLNHKYFFSSTENLIIPPIYSNDFLITF